ncbi:MAG: hypothetical protein KME23_14905 [Goleter apudmare HA4340-LM2]|jgi:hypothetical protein|nr:hypothetical protein [Goleter apudmare HA4340-LM2]
MLLRRSSESPLFIGLIIITFTLITFSSWLSPKPFALKPFGVNEIMQLISLPLFISLLLERSLEVFITTWRGPTSEQLNMGIQQQNVIISQKRKLIEELEKEISALEANQVRFNQSGENSLGQQVLPDIPQYPREYLNKVRPQIDDLNTRLKDVNDQESKLLAYKSDTRVIALWISLLFGLLISTIGVRLIEPLMMIDDVSNPVQITIFRCLDTFLTGGLIAGGSEGIHKLIQVFVDFLEATSKQVKDR